jgi:hypothetical protein
MKNSICKTAQEKPVISNDADCHQVWEYQFDAHKAFKTYSDQKYDPFWKYGQNTELWKDSNSFKGFEIKYYSCVLVIIEIISVPNFTWWELPLKCKRGGQIRPMNIHSYGKGPSLSADSLSPLFFQNKVRALSVGCQYVHIMRKDHTSTISVLSCTDLGSNMGNLSKYGSFLLLFLLVLFVIVNVYYTVIYTASTCVQFLTLITFFFILLKHL